jgi:glycosyltransferase involved in cell wall biosynthesis
MITGIDNLSFSVIINTIDRAGPLHTLLQSLEHQSYPNFEVVVVVGPTNDNTIELLSEFDVNAGLNNTHIYLQPKISRLLEELYGPRTPNSQCSNSD